MIREGPSSVTDHRLRTRQAYCGAEPRKFVLSNTN
jgi:hypothetical protein